MDVATQQARAGAFHRLHTGEDVLVLVNAWDAGSARLFELAGAPAIATTSAGMAWSLGYPDGEVMGVEELVAASRRICRAVSLPVSVDIERGFGGTLAEVCDTIRALLDAGVVGINIEDGVTPGTSALVPPSVLVEKIAAIRSVARAAGIQLFVNARTNGYFVPCSDPAARYQDAVRRLNAYCEAGADGVFVPGLEHRDEIARMVQAVRRPLNIYAGYAGLPSVDELRLAGVRRVSVGCGPLQAALALARGIATELLTEGGYESMTRAMLPAREINEMFAAARSARVSAAL